MLLIISDVENKELQKIKCEMSIEKYQQLIKMLEIQDSLRQ